MSRTICAYSSDRQQYLTHNYNDNTIRFVLHYPDLIDPQIMKASVQQVVDASEILHSSFHVAGPSACWQVNKSYEESHFFRHIHCDGDPGLTACSLALVPVFPEDKVQLKVWLVQSDTSASLAVVISHLCVDGGDGKYLLAKILEGYNLIRATGSARDLQVKNGTRAPKQCYGHLSFREHRALVKSPFASAKSLYPYPNEAGGTVQYLLREIPAEIMDAARAKAKNLGASANDLLVAALSHSYCALPGVDRNQPLAITSLIDLRRHCPGGESSGLCNLSGTMPTTLENGLPDSFEETLRQVAAQTAAQKTDPYAGLGGMPLMHSVIRSIPMGLLVKITGKFYGKMSLGITNMGNIRCADYALGGIAPTGGFFGGPVKKKPAMQVSVMSFDGTCVLSVCGQFTDEDTKLLRSTLDTMAEYIEEYAH